ncbi:NAD(P)-dependent alcohol dehydrogenase [Campylobacter sp. MIT 12-8780]|uniref:NAD(P)-dependent alcohol dehydrogenase n=1 Tax=unclassified Campylobacter TaxID=2593542 RepID=UPI00115F6CC0|nr:MULTISPECIES: NAD(P)-dependent alcohol dehydrogenase [unclassified Campylobacter]NDJ27120.1 alcohol dehydrogenase catalytic domain-containing protein [Campylobacter sp. MIT 19-121]TQR41582.1 NAD(P)-dependent alcohol dehydrogenase [Campylobacter sp. MIT 12-8780]
MQNEDRREFLKSSAKLGGVALASVAGLGIFSNASAKSLSLANGIKIDDSLEASTQEAIKNGARIESKGFAASSKEWKFKPFSFSRHPIGANDILIDILYAGICHSDLHAVNGDFKATTYPIVPGHEIAGRVVAVGSKVSKFKVGDLAGIGCMVNSCGECEACKRSEEQFCINAKTVFTYDSKDVFHGGENTYGGYANNYVVSEKFALKIPNHAELEKVAPLLCAGITTYSPIRYSKVKKGDKVAVAGVGGLGHMALQYMVALGAEVTAFDRVASKKDAVLALGAKRFVDVNNKAEFESIKNEFDFIISTIPYHYDINAYQAMLKLHGEMAIVGLPANKDNPSFNANAFIWNFRRKIYSSLIGGIKETQEMLDYSVKNKIYPKVELITADKLDEAYQKVARGEADFRIVIDMKKSLS